MGNAVTSPLGCIPIISPLSSSSSSSVKVILFDGTTRVMYGKRQAAEIMFEFPDCMVCDTASFYIGRPIPAVEYDAHLVPGETYLLLPMDSFPSSGNLSVSSLAALGRLRRSSPAAAAINIKERPFEYVKGSDGSTAIKVTPEFMISLVTRHVDDNNNKQVSSGDHGVVLCSTPELRKHYEDLVGASKVQVWSPKLETISESKARYSPWRCIGLREKEVSDQVPR